MSNDRNDASFEARTFVQTATSAISELDHWPQITEGEVRMVADMTRRNAISGGTPVVREFEKTWRKWIGTRYSVSTLNGLSTDTVMAAINEHGFSVSRTGYPNLHTLPLFFKGFDVFTRNRGRLGASEGYKGYTLGDFPNAELAYERTVFLPRLSNPVPNAVALLFDAMRKAADSSAKFAARVT